jgi:RNA polymerase sigma-70 factor (ECF subfamily)
MTSMRTRAAEDLTGLLRAWTSGDASALDRLTPIVYAELHRLASRQMAGEHAGHVLQPSALVNEAFVRLIGNVAMEWNDRNHFYAVLARMMRQILTDFARARDAGKRGRGAVHLDVTSVRDLAKPRPALAAEDLVAVDEAVRDLAALDQRQAQIVELRFFGGLENAEIASVLGVSEPTVVRDWRHARAWLFDRLGPTP